MTALVEVCNALYAAASMGETIEAAHARIVSCSAFPFFLTRVACVG
ncbi:hypothetical protein [Rhizobium sp. AB2/73]|nr:hypothetical protein [Rhizobium sp. AB2/73]QYA17457.1 hypothetical protein J5284_33875 [Rhizobium sp. AB2/73]UEQ85778.1 hypothetical protein I8E17_33855 [Rhizobium sp. AB2/73]